MENTSNNGDNNQLIPLNNSLAVENVSRLLILTNKLIKSYLQKVTMDLIPYKRSDEDFQIYDYKNKRLIDTVFSHVEFINFLYSKSIFVRSKKGFSYAILDNAEQLKELKFYSRIRPIITQLDVLLIIVNKDGYTGVINDKNEIVLHLIYDSIKFVGSGKNSYFIYEKDDLWGLFHLESFDEILELNFDSIETQNCDENILLINRGGNIGLINLLTQDVQFISSGIESIKYSEGMCAIKKEEGWLFMNLTTKQFINKSTYSHAEHMLNGFALCKKRKQNILVFMNGAEINIGEANEKYERKGDIIFGHISSNDRIYFKIYNREILISEFSIPWSNDHLPLIRITPDNFLAIQEYYSNKGYYSNIPILYSLQGIKLVNNKSNEIPINEIYVKSDANKTNISQTNWRIVNKSLFYKEECIHFCTEPIEELYVSEFCFGIAKVIEIIAEYTEYGEDSNFIGYIDINGNKYWD